MYTLMLRIYLRLCEKKAMRDTIRKEIRLMREVLRIRHREYSHLV